MANNSLHHLGAHTDPPAEKRTSSPPRPLPALDLALSRHPPRCLPPGTIISLHTQHDPRRASRFTWCAGCDDNDLLGAVELIDLLFEPCDLLLSLRRSISVINRSTSTSG
jgi:hypothetical protein